VPTAGNQGWLSSDKGATKLAVWHRKG